MFITFAFVACIAIGILCMGASAVSRAEELTMRQACNDACAATERMWDAGIRGAAWVQASDEALALHEQLLAAGHSFRDCKYSR